MSFDSLEAFLSMGGHGLYVWISYGAAAIVILFNFVWPLRLNKEKIRMRQRLLQREKLRLSEDSSSGSEN